MAHGLIDVYELLVFPVVLGEGKRLFETGLDRSLRLVDSYAVSSPAASTDAAPWAWMQRSQMPLEKHLSKS